MRLLLAPAALLAAIVWGSIGWGLLSYVVVKADPWSRLVVASSAGRLLGREGTVVLVGDSILKSVGSPCPTFANFAVPGARALDVPADLIADIARLKPSVILVMFGINDLRAGADPAETAQSVAALARSLQAAVSQATVVVLAPLPITHNSNAGAASNAAVVELASSIRLELKDDNVRVSDFAALFGKGELAPGLTGDGLHLNAQGVQLLATLVEAVAIAAGAKACR